MRQANIDGFLPIAGSLSEDVCLSVYKTIGAITLTEYIYDGDVSVGAKMHFVAHSFSEFISALEEIKAPQCRLEDLGRCGEPNDLVKYLAEGNSLNALDQHGVTIVCEAVKFNNIAMLDACIKHRADLSGTIYMAVQNRRIALIPRLVCAGADVNELDDAGKRPLFYVGGGAVPGRDGFRNRKLREMLIGFGAHE
jgi:hypothetical protein